MSDGAILVGTYWPQRRESKEQAAKRIGRFLDAMSTANGSLFEQWFLKGRSKASANAVLSTDVSTLAAALESNRRDVGGEEIAELGFNLAIWNGESGSFEATVGAFSPHVSNSAVSIADGAPSLTRSDWKRVLEAAIEAFDPEHAIVTTHENWKQSESCPSLGSWLAYLPVWTRTIRAHLNSIMYRVAAVFAVALDRSERWVATLRRFLLGRFLLQFVLALQD
jgi:hypothetical protein